MLVAAARIYFYVLLLAGGKPCNAAPCNRLKLLYTQTEVGV